MKKCLALLLTAALLLLTAAPAYAVDYSSPSRDVPVILLRGDGEPLYDKDGNMVFDATDLTAVFDGVDKNDAYESIAAVLQPFLLEGLLLNRWDRYYENLEKEIGALTESFRLDENGEPSNGTSISQRRKQENEANTHVDKRGDKGYFGYFDYRFWYDWRLDPLEVADQLNDYINAVLAVTGAEKVALASRCVGTTVVLAYAAKYGTSKLQGVGIDGTCTNGGEFLSDAISGKFKLDGDALCRFLTDCDATGAFDVSAFAMASVELLNKSGALNAFKGAFRATVYNRIKEGATSAIALSTVFTMPCYWAFVTAEDYETAKQYVFGPEGSEKRQKYAGLIAKLDNYHETVRLHLDEIMLGLREDGVNVCVISKYGFQIVPICETCDLVSDQYASVMRSSFGATTSTVYDTLSDEYVAGRTAQGLGRYISPDRQVDASTCLLPDCTWFVKGTPHGDWLDEEDQIMYNVCTADRQLTVDDLPYTQFFVYDDETETVSPMTAENCRTEYWSEADMQKPGNVFDRIRAYFKALKTWLVLFRELLQEKTAAE